MNNTIRKAAFKRKTKRNRRYTYRGGVVKLAAKLSGRAPSSIYHVLNHQYSSAPIEACIGEAVRMLAATRCAA